MSQDSPEKPLEIPAGLAHLAQLVAIRQMAKHDSKLSLNSSSYKDMERIGDCLSALYQAATCHRKCHGGAHILESLCGRAYNLAAAALELTLSGYYDEALNLTRSIGEISNLISLSVVDKVSFNAWLAADTQTRIRTFSPGAIRKLLEAAPDGKALMYADSNWYSHFCETYTHATPLTKPNAHSSGAHVGGKFQKKGMDDSLNELSTVLSFISMIICRYFKFDDILKKL
jgi:hypothetical protein